jgi:hypothetical protein
MTSETKTFDLGQPSATMTLASGGAAPATSSRVSNAAEILFGSGPVYIPRGEELIVEEASGDTVLSVRPREDFDALLRAATRKRGSKG